jgi:hypothetical protein
VQEPSLPTSPIAQSTAASIPQAVPDASSAAPQDEDPWENKIVIS